MQNDIKIGLNVSSDGSTDAEIKKAEKLKRALDLAAESAERIGGTAGSRAAAARAARGAAGGAMSNEEFGSLRGTAGLTGASARDFANQAQGLGGLVRVYATFAANLFAVSAAFTALREAAQTEQLAKGLERLAATSGRSLGTLSKELVNATGGAISLREAMTAVAQASSAGLANEQIKQLSVVANQAAQALGLSMTDALNRLSRGISKIEPELLDELGIFVRVDTAVQNYALSLGKSASTLSDFERRQAFANAVLEQGQKKFGAIEAAANPFDKLLASVKDLSERLLNLVNKALTPVISLLAENPGALTALFAVLGGILLKQAIPAIGQFRAGLRASAEEALDAAKAFKQSFGDEFQARLEKTFEIPQLEQGVRRAENALKGLKPPKSLTAESVTALTTATESNKKALDSVNELLTRRNAIIETGMKGSKKASAEQIQQATEERNYIQKVLDAYKARIALQEASAKAQKVADKPQGRLDPETIALRKYIQLKTAFDKAEVISNAAQNASIVGIRQSWVLLNKEIGERGLTGFAKYSAQIQGGLAAIGTRITGIISSFGMWAEIAAVAGVAFTIFDSYASRAAKEQQAFNKELDESASKVKTVNDAFELYTQKQKDGFGLDGIVAFTNALQGISTTLDNQLAALDKFAAAAGPWDRLKESVAEVFGKSNLDNLRKDAAETVRAVIKTLDFSSQADAAKDRLAEALNIPPEALSDTKKLNTAIQQLDRQRLDNLSTQIKQVTKEQQFATNAAQGFKESLTQISRLFDQVLQSTAFTDLQGRIGVELVAASDKLAQSLEGDLLKSIAAIADLSKDPKTLSILRLSPQEVDALFKASESVAAINVAQQELVKSTSKLIQAQELAAKTPPAFDEFSGEVQKIPETVQIILDEANAGQKRAAENLRNLKKEAEDFARVQGELVKRISEEGFRRVELGLKNARELARLTVEESRIDPARAAGLDVSQQEYNLTIARIKVEQEQIKASYDARLAQIQNTDALVQLSATLEKQMAVQELADRTSKLTESERARLRERVQRATETERAAKIRRELLENKRTQTSLEEEFGAEAVKKAGESLNRDKQIADLQRQAALAATNAQIQIAGEKRIRDAREFQFKLSQEILDLEAKQLATRQTYIDLTRTLGVVESEAIQTAKLQADLSTIELDRQKQQAQLDKDRQDVERNTNKLNADSAKQRKEILNLRQQELNNSIALRTLQAEINAINTKYSVKVTETTNSQALQEQSLSQTNTLLRSNLDVRQRELDALNQTGAVDERNLVIAKTAAELEQQRLKFLEDRAKLLGDIELKQLAVNKAEAIARAARNQVERDETGTNTVLQQAAQDAEDALQRAKTQLAISQGALSTADTINTQTLKSIETTGQLNLKLAEQKVIVDSIKTASEGLSTVFGDLGTKFAGFINTLTQTLLQSRIASEATARQLKDVGEQLENNAALQRSAQAADDQDLVNRLIDERIVLENRRTSIIQKAQRDELNSTIAIIGGTKKLFKEKTGAYKALDILEKGLHLARLAREYKELATKLFVDKTGVASKTTTIATETGLENAGLAARTPTLITGIFAKITDQLGVFGPPVAAALVAAIFGRALGFGRNKIPAGVTAEERQAVVGTGQEYVDGKLVNRSGGVLGDNKAVADSITSSIDTLSKEVFNTLGSSSSKIVKALESINKNTELTVKALIGQLVGTTGTNNLQGFLQPGKTGPNIGLGLAGGAAGAAFGATFVGAFGNLLLPVIGGVIGAAVGSLLTSAKTSIIDQGVKITGSLDNLTKELGSFQQFQTAKVERRFLFFKDVDIVKEFGPLGEAAIKTFSDVFAGFQQVLIESANALEGPNNTLIEAIKNTQITLDVSLQGLSAKEALEKLSAELSVQLNKAAESIFPYIKNFVGIGEEYYEAVARIVKESETLKMGLERVGIAIQGLGTQARIALEQQLIEQLGGVDKAVSSINFYYENFLTNEERFRIQFNQLTKTFRDAGKTLPQTKQEFINLLSGLDIVNNVEDQRTFALLINNAESYNDLLELQNEIIGDTKRKFEDFAKSLLSFKDSLLLGSATVLTPIERYAKAKTEFETIRAKALAGDQESLGRLQDASQTFLNVSRELYASGQQYTADFNSVLKTLDDATGYAKTQADMGQMQLNALNTQIGVLQNIERILTLQESRTATTPTTPGRQQALDAAADQFADRFADSVVGVFETRYGINIRGGDTDSNLVNERANGGFASGLTLVGERGPELVDFNKPGMVYTAEQTRGMFAPRTASGQAIREMVTELQDLREEVVQLRKEQQKQTGDMIITNYDAQQKVADDIVQAVMKSVQEKSWQDKNKPTIS